MRVFRLSLRTPGIFLDREGNDFKGTLEFQLRRHSTAPVDEGDWETPENLGIIVTEVVVPDVVSENIPTVNKVVVPARDEGRKDFDIVIPDEVQYDYRIVATNCPECWTFFEETGRGTILDSNNRKGRIIVGNGTIGGK